MCYIQQWFAHLEHKLPHAEYSEKPAHQSVGSSCFKWRPNNSTHKGDTLHVWVCELSASRKEVGAVEMQMTALWKNFTWRLGVSPCPSPTPKPQKGLIFCSWRKFLIKPCLLLFSAVFSFMFEEILLLFYICALYFTFSMSISGCGKWQGLAICRLFG